MKTYMWIIKEETLEEERRCEFLFCTALVQRSVVL